jgi:hypothetical protein
MLASARSREHVHRRRRERGEAVEAFVPQVHAAGVEAEVDWGEAQVAMVALQAAPGRPHSPDARSARSRCSALHQAARRIAEQPAGPEDLSLTAPAREQPVDQPIGQLLTSLLRQLARRKARPDPLQGLLRQLTRERPAAPGGRRAAGISLRSPSGLAPRNVGETLNLI